MAAGQVGGARFQRLGRDKGFAVVVVRDTHGSWGALTLVLRCDRAGAWRIIEVTRPALASDGLAATGDRGADGVPYAGQSPSTPELQCAARALLRTYWT